MGGLSKELTINRKFEYSMFKLKNQCYDTKTGEIQDDTKEILLGVIIDDFENKKEIFIPAEKIGIEKDEQIQS